jgi:hypothetical protein
MGFGTVALVAMEPGEAHGGTQFPHLGLLLLGDAQGFAIELFGGCRMLDRKVLLGGGYSEDAWPSPRPLWERALHPRLSPLSSLVVILLLSFGLWAAIWATLTSLASAIMR